MEEVRRIAVIGDRKVGKSSFLIHIAQDSFEKTFEETELHTVTKTVDCEGGHIRLELSEFYSNQQIQESPPNKFSVALLMYDITNRESFESISQWYGTVKKDFARIVIIGTKSDMEENRSVSYLEGFELAESLNSLFTEISSLDGANIHTTLKFDICGGLLRTS